MDSLPEDAGAGPRAVLSRFRRDFHACLTARGDEVFELADAVLCAGEPVRSLPALSLAVEHRRGHGALYDAVNHGRMDIARLRRSLAGLPLPRAADGRLMLAVECEQLAAAWRGNQPGQIVLPCVWPGEGPGADDPGLALLGGRSAGAWPHVLDCGAGRGPPGPG